MEINSLIVICVYLIIEYKIFYQKLQYLQNHPNWILDTSLPPVFQYFWTAFYKIAYLCRRFCPPH
jgi:hypothetical protein